MTEKSTGSAGTSLGICAGIGHYAVNVLENLGRDRTEWTINNDQAAVLGDALLRMHADMEPGMDITLLPIDELRPMVHTAIASQSETTITE